MLHNKKTAIRVWGWLFFYSTRSSDKLNLKKRVVLYFGGVKNKQGVLVWYIHSINSNYEESVMEVFAFREDFILLFNGA